VGKKRHFSMIILAHPVAFCLHDVPRDVSLYHHFQFFGVCIKIVFDNLMPVVISNWPAATNLLILIFYTHRP
jgi:hypothetical protein